MRLTITILCGTRAGQRFVVGSGENLRVGRTAKADFVVADDPTMSALHFELECRNTDVIARDLGSRNRLFVNGEAVVEAILLDGDQLRAGRTFFSISIVDPLAPGVLPNADETCAPGPLDATHADVRAANPNAMPAATLFPGQLVGDPDFDYGTADDLSSDPPEARGQGERQV